MTTAIIQNTMTAGKDSNSLGKSGITSFGSQEYFLQRGSRNALHSNSPSPPTAKSNTNGNNNAPKTWNPPPHTTPLSQAFQDTWSEFRLQAPSSSPPITTITLSDSSRSCSESHGTSRTPSHCSESPPRDAPVVSLSNANKSYGKGRKQNLVLENLNMTVHKGQIYGLLGASGCGKTTVLSCIVGRRILDEGTIRVFGGIPGNRKIGIPGKRVGYMPQELALYGEFTIQETLQYFGRLYGMKKSNVREQIEFLLKFLDLKEKKKIISTLSGGQQRRVSFAVALLHDPELLILDEPTVGVDPMLRQSIWSHLLNLVNEKHKTIIITTHYIEEARQANVVGLMRSGRLLAEGPPNSLLEQYQMTTLEEVFLQLCSKDSGPVSPAVPTSQGLTNVLMSSLRLSNTLSKRKRGSLVYPGITGLAEDISIQPISYSKKNEESEFQKIKRRLSMKKSSRHGDADQYKASCCQFSVPSLSKIWALMCKNFIKMWRNVSQLLFIFLLPAIQVVFFCVAIGRDPSDLKIAVVNNEVSDAYMTNNCPVSEGCEFSNLSCRFFDNLFQQKAFVPVYYPDEDSAYQSVKDGKSWGIITTQGNFSKYFLKRLWSSIDADEETLNKSSINVQLDNSNQQVSFVMQKAFREGYKDFFRGLLTDCEFPEETGDIPLVFGDSIYGPDEPNFTDFMAPGIIILIIFFLALALTGELFVTEKRDGLLDRSWIAGVLPSEVLIAHVFTQFLVLIGQTTITLVFILLVFQVPCEGPVGWLIGLTLLQGTAGMCYGMLLSSIFVDMASNMQVAIGSFYPNLLLSGILWPIEGMPWYLREVARYLPCTAACQAMRDVMSRGWDASMESVYYGYISTTSWIGIFLLFTWISIKLQST